MLAERVYKLFITSVTSLMLFYILKNGDFLHIYLLGDQESPQYFKHYPCPSVPKFLDDFYVVKLSYHGYEMLYTLAFHRGRRDFPEYVLHHLVTLALILFSYSINQLTLGSIIMLIHDISDTTVSIFKLTCDVASTKVQLFTYILMIVSWIYFRLWFFPLYLIKGYIDEAFHSSHYV
jgi:hypothetical protein